MLLSSRRRAPRKNSTSSRRRIWTTCCNDITNPDNHGDFAAFSLLLVTDAGSGLAEVTLNGYDPVVFDHETDEQHVTFDAIEPGRYILAVKDEAGNETFLHFSIVDTDPPLVVLTGNNFGYGGGYVNTGVLSGPYQGAYAGAPVWLSNALPPFAPLHGIGIDVRDIGGLASALNPVFVQQEANAEHGPWRSSRPPRRLPSAS